MPIPNAHHNRNLYHRYRQPVLGNDYDEMAKQLSDMSRENVRTAISAGVGIALYVGRFSYLLSYVPQYSGFMYESFT